MKLSSIGNNLQWQNKADTVLTRNMLLYGVLYPSVSLSVRHNSQAGIVAKRLNTLKSEHIELVFGRQATLG